MGESNLGYYTNEVKNLNKISQYQNETTFASPNILKYFGTFIHISIGHDLAPRCHPIVEFELQHGTVYELLNECVKRFDEGLSLTVVKRITKQVLAGLNYLHKCGLIHTDICPDNILLTKSVDEILDSNSIENVNIVIGDLGSATFADDIFSEDVGKTNYMAPELILDLKYDYAIDIWATFVMCYELFTGDYLFDVYNECDIMYNNNIESSSESTSDSEMTDSEEIDDSGSETSNSSGDEDEDYQITNYNLLLLMEKILGSAPRELTEDGRAYFNSRGKLKNNPQVDHISISELLQTNYSMESDECKSIEEFLLYGLKYLPEDRPTAEQALQHPWLQ
jgi:serine/threonine protein kinase